jgi:hypothetical protein
MPRDRHASADELPAPGHAGVTGMAPDPHYEIRVLGSLDGHWTAWFERRRRGGVATAAGLGDQKASKRLAAAAHVMARDPAALQLRLLQTVVEVAAEKNSTLVMPVPVELLRFFDRLTPQVPAGDRKSAEDSASLADFGDEDAAEAEITSGAPLEKPEVPPIPQLPIQVSNGKLPAAVAP